MGFSYEWDLFINGFSADDKWLCPWNNLKITHSVSGFGTSGVITGQLEFDIYDRYGQLSDALLENVPVFLKEKNDRILPSRTYYIAKRSVSRNVCHFTAYDIMSRAEQQFDVTKVTFLKGDDKVPCGNIMEYIREQCGFTGVTASSTEGLDYIRFTREQLTGRTVRSVLEMIAKAMCGVWIAKRDNGIVLSCFGSPYGGISYSDEYSGIDYQGRQKITRLICVNSDTGNIKEYGTGEYGTVFWIESPFLAAGTQLDNIVWERINGYIYQAWKCSKALLSIYNTDSFPAAVSYINFGETSLIANNITITPDHTGIYISAGCDPQNEEQWKYEEYLERAKIGIDKLIGSTKISGSGRIVFVNLNKDKGGGKNG